jgi:transposase
MIGVDLAKHVFAVHGCDGSGAVVFRKTVRRGELVRFLAGIEPCVVAMEACGSAHHWGREIGKLGHEVRLIAPAYVKPFVKRQKNDAADAEAICEAAQRPTMRFVPVKSEAAQAAALLFRTRDLLVGQRTQAINALRGHLYEYGIVASKGVGHVAGLVARIERVDGVGDNALPEAARAMLGVLAETIGGLDRQIAMLDREIAHRARHLDVARRLMTLPGVGPVTATALAALAPADRFARGRDFAAWLGLVPLQQSSGGRQRLGRTSKMGERSLRRLLIIGASAVVSQAVRRGAPAGSWLARMLASKPRMLVIVALANKMARIAWALMTRNQVYKAPAVAA